MPVEYVYQDSAVINEIAPDLIQSTALQDPIFKYFPIRELNAAKLRWTMKDNLRGLMALRGAGGPATAVQRPPNSLYESDPGYFGEYGLLDEQELTERAVGFPANMTIPMNVSDMVREIQNVLTVRQTQRMRMMAWTLATTHILQVPLPTGGWGLQESFPGQSLTVATLWSNLTTSTPLHDLRQLQLLFGRGTSNDFMGRAVAFVTAKTAGWLLDNRNPADVGGVRAEYGQTIFSLADFNKIALSQGAPQLQIFEDSYQVDNVLGVNGDPQNNDYQMYLPDGVVLVIAARPGNEPPGQFMYTRHMVNGGGTKPYAFINDFTKEVRPSVPPKIEVHQGFNGGVVQERPTQTVTMTVG